MACGPRESTETSTDDEGRFSFSWTVRVGAGSDVSRFGTVGQFSGQADYSGCIGVALAGYSGKKIAASPAARSTGDLGLILLYPTKPGGASVISVTSFEAPGEARKAYKRGVKELRGKKPDWNKAAAAFREATAAYPQYAAAWTELGRVLARRREFDAARSALRQAIAADAGFVEPYPLLAAVALEQKDWAVVVSASERLLALRPGDTQAYFNLAMGQMGLQRFDDAEASAQRVADSALAERFPAAFHVLGVIHILQERFASAAAAFERYMALQPDSPLTVEMRALITEWRAAGRLESEVERGAAPRQLVGDFIP